MECPLKFYLVQNGDSSRVILGWIPNFWWYATTQLPKADMQAENPFLGKETSFFLGTGFNFSKTVSPPILGQELSPIGSRTYVVDGSEIPNGQPPFGWCWNPVNDEMFTISTGERWISEPSTVFSNIPFFASLHSSLQRPPRHPPMVKPTGFGGLIFRGQIYNPELEWSNWEILTTYLRFQQHPRRRS